MTEDGAEFTSLYLDAWAHANGIQLDFTPSDCQRRGPEYSAPVLLPTSAIASPISLWCAFTFTVLVPSLIRGAAAIARRQTSALGPEVHDSARSLARGFFGRLRISPGSMRLWSETSTAIAVERAANDL